MGHKPATGPMKKNREVPLPAGADWPERLDHGEFVAMVEGDELPFKRKTAAKLMAIARDPRITKGSHGRHLPPAWTTLYVLTKLDNERCVNGATWMKYGCGPHLPEIRIYRRSFGRFTPFGLLRGFCLALPSLPSLKRPS